ncbi:MAG: hypothetical protein NC548_31850 [Lachnospiraceae bacterium]|nr:hypothetical protein [Lachnospiraceae bacterium]
MAALEFKPCTLSYLEATPGYEDENGDYHAGVSQWQGEINCGYVPAGASNEIKYEDGSISVYSYTVTLPSNSREFVRGERVRLNMLNGNAQEFTVKSFLRYQLQCKMWV